MAEYYGVRRSGDYLAHYGVLGMKWGIRRAAKKGQKYEYKSHATKKYERLSKKLASQGKHSESKKMANRARRSKEIDKGEEAFARGISTRNAIGLAFLAGPSTMKAYAQHRAMEKQTGKNITGKKITSAVLAGYHGTHGSRIRKAGYIRQDEPQKGLINKVAKHDNKFRNDFTRYVSNPIASVYNYNKKRRR